MWRPFQLPTHRISTIRSTLVPNDRICVFGSNQANDIYWSRQTTKHGVYLGWRRLSLAGGGDLPAVKRFACGAISKTLVGQTKPVVHALVLAETLDVFDMRHLHVLSHNLDGDVWNRTRLDPPAPNTKPARLAILPAQTSAQTLGASLFCVDSDGALYRADEVVRASGHPSWTAWRAVDAGGVKVIDIAGSAACGTGVLAVLFDDGRVCISLQVAPGKWGAWRQIGGARIPDAAELRCIEDGFGLVQVFVSTSQGSILRTHEERFGQCTAGPWARFEDIGFMLTPGGGGLKTFHVARDDNQRVQVLALSQDNTLWQSWQKNWKGRSANLANTYIDGGGKFTKFIRVFTEEDKFSDVTAIADPAFRIHVFAVPSAADAPPRHGLVWGYKIHVRAVKVRDDLDVVEPHPPRDAPLNGSRENFKVALTNCNAVYRNSGFQFVFDPQSDWDEIANTAINRDHNLASAGKDAQGDVSDHWAYCDRFPDSVICFLRFGGGDAPDGGAYSAGPEFSDGRFVALAGFFSDEDVGGGFNTRHGSQMAHEFGHYFGLPHTFRDYPAYPAGANVAQVHQHLIDVALRDVGPAAPETDVDRRDDVFDTPFDPGPSFYSALKPGSVGEAVAGNAAVTVSGMFNGTRVIYDIAPDTNNLMSYYQGNPVVTEAPASTHLSPDQIVRMHLTLRHPLRRQLLRPPVT